jgi:hypothetical protein
VWTGEEMILWGGCCDERGREFDDGAAYDPATDRWRPLPAAPISRRTAHTAVWTGREMVVWGGHEFEEEFSDGAAYDPQADDWRLLADPSLAPRFGHTALWTGSEMVVWGGATAQGDVLADGAAYRPDAWEAIDSAPAGRSDHEAAWTGQEMVVWGGCCTRDGGPLEDGLVFNPTEGRWRTVPPAGLSPRQDHTAVWTGSSLVVWGGRAGLDRAFTDGSAYEPAANRWAELPPAPLAPRGGHSSVWTGGEMVVWGGCCDEGQEGFPDGAALRLESPATPTPSVQPSPVSPAPPPEPARDDGAAGSFPIAAVVATAALLAAGIGVVVRSVRSRGNTWSG